MNLAVTTLPRTIGGFLTGLALMAGGCDQPATPPASQSTAATKSPVSVKPTDAEVAAAQKKLQESAGAARTSTGADGTAALPPGHPPTGPATVTDASPPAAAGDKWGNLAFDPPESWKSLPTTSAMRLAVYSLPGATADAPAEMVVTAFPPTGAMADVPSNVARWVGAFKTADGSPLPESAIDQTSMEKDGLKITVVRMSGMYTAPASMGGTGQAAPSEHRQLVAMVTAPERVYFFKLLGPAELVKTAEPDFDKLVASLRTKK